MGLVPRVGVSKINFKGPKQKVGKGDTQEMGARHFTHGILFHVTKIGVSATDELKNLIKIARKEAEPKMDM